MEASHLKEKTGDYPEESLVEIIGPNHPDLAEGTKIVTNPDGNVFKIAPEMSDEDYIPTDKDFKDGINFTSIEQLEKFFEMFGGLHFNKWVIQDYLNSKGITYDHPLDCTVPLRFKLCFRNLQEIYTLANEVRQSMSSSESLVIEA